MTVPATAVSHIMLEAYKKYLLIWLIVHGDMSQEALVFPKYTSPVVNKYIRTLSAPYWLVIDFTKNHYDRKPLNFLHCVI